MSPGRVLTGMVLGLVGGILAELVDANPGHPLTRDVPGALAGWEFYVLGAVLGLFVGTGLGITDGLYTGSRTRFWRALAAGALGGPVCGFVAFGIGGYLYGALGGDAFHAVHSPADVLQQVIARTSGWALMGLLLGTVGGLPDQSLPRMRNGAIGGFIGGSLGGFVLETLASARLFAPFHLRLISFAVTGAAIGFFVGLVGEVFKRAWVKVLVGRNEGREHVIDSSYAVIGRDELASIPVFIDPYLSPRQASIRYLNGRYCLFDEAGRQDTRWRGQLVPATGQPLSDGDLFQVGKATLVFYEKASASPAGRPSVAPPAPVAIPPAGGAVCEFCGVARDPATGACACTVGQAVQPAYGATAGQPVQPGYPGYDPGRDPSTVMIQPGEYENPFAPYMSPPAPPAAGGWGAPTVYDYPAPGAQAGPRLVGLSGPYTGQVFPLAAPVTTIGREAGRTVALVADSRASRRHASIYGEPNGYVLRDDGSSNGTFVNNTRVMEHLLYPGDEIRVGTSAFRFEV
jgi:pSer/pThr/pTyr-binding forkhead associated (FHA) protein